MSQRQRIAIAGMACRYPDARSPEELWQTVLARRRAFRPLPAERLRLDDYRPAAPGAPGAPVDPDSIELREAAVLAGWDFDRVRFRVGAPSFRAADLTHWLALEVAADALADAGFPDGRGLPRADTGVLFGNTLTGEFSRAQLQRLRWPYVHRTFAAALAAEGWDAARIAAFLDREEAAYKAPFPAPTEETLAGGLANTIAGRICNHFDLHGGGYTVDGACASSLLAIAQACTALAAGDLDVAIAGGVDLSLDPFELVGFARAGALTPGDMRVYDAHSQGFLPGEGCGALVLLREADARAQGTPIRALIAGWGISSDGQGGLTRPEPAGQRLALARAYRRAGFPIHTVAYFEGHGTGTAVGDAAELTALTHQLQQSRSAAAPGEPDPSVGEEGRPAASGKLGPTASGKLGPAASGQPGLTAGAKPGPTAGWPAAAIGSVKANIGHTKAAAGVAGLIKAVRALETQLLPPTTGCAEPHPYLAAAGAPLRALAAAEPWPAALPLRAGVSAMGFGGINAHLALEAAAPEPRRGSSLSPAERRLAAPPQSHELILLRAATPAGLAARARHLAALAPRLARAELADLAVELQRRLASEDAAADRENAATAGAERATVFAAAGRQAVAAVEQQAAAAVQVHAVASVERQEVAGLERHAVAAAERQAAVAVEPQEVAAAGGRTAPEQEAAGAVRAAIVAATPRELAERLTLLAGMLDTGLVGRRFEPRRGIFVGTTAPGEPPPRVGFLFTGQGSFAPTTDAAETPGGALAQHFADLSPDPHRPLAALEPAAARAEDAASQQRAIVAHDLAGARWLERLGVEGAVGVGHSLGEIAALAWAGACDEPAALALATDRGVAIARHGEPGEMASLGAPLATVEELITRTGATLAARNAAERTVVSGPPPAIAAVLAAAAARGIPATRLKVAHAYHSPGVAAAAPALARALAAVAWAPPRRAVASTVTGALLAADADPRQLLLAQLTAPVRFADALAAAQPLADLWVELGPGRTLADLAAETLGVPPLALDTGGPTLAPALAAAGALFAAGVPLALDYLFADRFTRPFDPDRPLTFLSNPCESAPLPIAAPPTAARSGAAGHAAASPEAAAGQAASSHETVARPGAAAHPEAAAGVTPSSGSPAAPLAANPAFAAGPGAAAGAPKVTTPPGAATPAGTASTADPAIAGPDAAGTDPLATLRRLVADRTALPESAIAADSRLLGDLHLNSISVGQLVVDASRSLGLPPPISPTDYAQATVAEIAQSLADRLAAEPSNPAAAAGPQGSAATAASPIPGVDTWVHPFVVHLVEQPLPVATTHRPTTDARPPQGTSAPDQAGDSRWRLVALPDHPLAQALHPALEAAARRQPALAAAAAPGVAAAPPAGPDLLLCLPADLDADDPRLLELFATTARSATAALPPARVVVVQHGGGGGGFARSLHLERPGIATWLLDLPPDLAPATAARLVAAELAAADAHGAPGYTEAHYDARAVRRVPRLQALDIPPAAAAAGLGPRDVLLVTGGGKGIGAECALAAARESGARLVILGRADPAADPDLAANLERMKAVGAAPLYLRADVTDPAAAAAAVARATAAAGPITALFHAAGINRPRRLADIDAAGLRATLEPKVHGLANLLAALTGVAAPDAASTGAAAPHTTPDEGARGDALPATAALAAAPDAALAATPGPSSLRLVVAFGSIIARTGLHGEAEYALANDWMERHLDVFAARHPACRCLTLDWSVWSGTGMGERLGTLEALGRQGITPIPPDTGVAILLRLLAAPTLRGAVVVAGRFGAPPTLLLDRPPLPLLRFLETPRVHYPGIELVADSELSADSDPYLADHVFRGEPLFAAVLGLEAMAQAATALTGLAGPPVFEHLELRRPVVVPPGRTLTLRVAALVRAPGRVEVALRDSSTAFATDHFRALCTFPAATGSATAPPVPAAALPHPAIDPARDLYGTGILFHTGRFRRLAGYHLLRATACVATIEPAPGTTWFGRYLPATLLLGDPGARDAALHAIQACIPHAHLLPVGVERIATHRLPNDQPLRVAARERHRDGATFVYDLEILGADGTLIESWHGLSLRAVQPTTPLAAWTPALLAPYLERRCQELLPAAGLRIALAPGAAATAPPTTDTAIAAGSIPPPTLAAPGRRNGRPDSAALIAHLLADPANPAPPAPAPRLHRPDGRAEVPGAPALSVAHAAGLVLAVAGRAPADLLGCDLESVAERSPETWQALLGPDRHALALLIARESAEPPATAATRVWTALEALHKAGAPLDTPLLLDTPAADGWLLLRAGHLRVATYTTFITTHPPTPLALAIATGA